MNLRITFVFALLCCLSACRNLPSDAEAGPLQSLFTESELAVCNEFRESEGQRTPELLGRLYWILHSAINRQGATKGFLDRNRIIKLLGPPSPYSLSKGEYEEMAYVVRVPNSASSVLTISLRKGIAYVVGKGTSIE